ncbi:hypothetical protein BS78_10G199100 [Paspalum vaginatum]|nr:hypothetical protein BS78_10G199100 [Paspalum vaginatum]
MMRGRRAAMAAACCLVVVMALLLAQGVQSRNLLWKTTGEQDKQTHGGGSGNLGAGTATATDTQEPCSDARGGGGAAGGSAGKGEPRCDDAAKWAELHTDYIYTQDVKHP